MNSQQRTSLRLASNSSRIRCIWWPKQSKKRLEPFSDEGDRAPDREGCQGHIICSFDKIICQGAEVGLAKSEMTHPPYSPLQSPPSPPPASCGLRGLGLQCTQLHSAVYVNTTHCTQDITDCELQPETAHHTNKLQPTCCTNHLGSSLQYRRWGRYFAMHNIQCAVAVAVFSVQCKV